MENKKWWALTGISLLFLAAGIDFTIISVALPTIQAKLNLSLVQSQWVINIYLLINCILLATMGYLGDRYGQRSMLYFSFLLFLIAALLSGLAPDAFWLIAGRGMQGLVETILMPCSLALISSIFAEKERGLAIGIWGGFGGAGMIIGAGIGGFIVSYLGWRWTFFIKLPVVFIALVIFLTAVPEARNPAKNKTFDWLGVLTISLAIAGLIIPIINGSEWGWISVKTVGLFLLSVIAWSFFYRIEKQAKNPIIQLALFNNHAFLICAVTQFVLAFFACTTMFLTPLYLQNIRNIAPAAMGLLFMVVPGAMLIFSLIAGYLTDKFSARKPLLLGLACFIVAAFLQILFTPVSAIACIFAAFVFLGAGWGLLLSATSAGALNALKNQFISASIGFLWTFQIAGGAIGLAIAGALFRHQDKITLTADLNAAHINLTAVQQEYIRSLLSEPEQAKQILQSFGVNTAQKILPLFDHAFLQGYASVMGLLLTVSLLCFVAAFFKLTYTQDT